MATVVCTTAILGQVGIQATIKVPAVVVCTTPIIGMVAMQAAVLVRGRAVQLNEPVIAMLPLDASLPGHPIVVNVLGWTPADGDTNVELGHSVAVNFSALASNEHEINYDSDAEFNQGVYDQTKVVSDEISLTEAVTVEDFEGMTVDAFPAPGWTNMMGAGGMHVKAHDGRKSIQCISSNTKAAVGWTVMGDSPSDRIIYSKFQYSANITQHRSGACLRLTGSGSTFRGYWAGTSYLGTRLYRFTGGTGATGITTEFAHGLSMSTSKWYWQAFLVTNNNFYCKVWEDGTSEPGSWTWMKSDTTHLTGDVGYCHSVNIASGYTYNWCDEVQTKGYTPQFFTSGTWVSDWVQLDAVGRFSGARITWEATLPTGDTAVVVHVRRGGEAGTWLACTNGEPLPGFGLDDGMRNEVVQFRATLTTSDTEETPLFGNLQIIFDPMDFEQLEIVVGGRSATWANNKLEAWGKRVKVGSAVQNSYADLWARASVPWAEFYTGPVLAQLKYIGSLIDEITFNAADLAWYHSGDSGNVGRWQFVTDVREEEPNTFKWTAWGADAVTGHTYMWTLVDRTQGIHADGRYWVAHVQLDDHVGSAILAALELSDHAGSALYKGYKRDDHAGSAVVQGYRIDDHVGSALVSEEFMYDHVGSAVVAALVLSDHVGSALVYQVNRQGHLEYDVITDEAWTQMVADGFGMA